MAVKIKEEAKGIYRLGPLETNHDSGPTSPFLVVGTQKTMVVEPGQDGQAAGIVEGIKQLGIKLEQVEYVWASHIHIYHVQGLNPLLKLLPKAKFLVHPRGARHVVDVTRLMEQTVQIWSTETPEDIRKGVKRCYGPMLPVPADKVTSVEDKQVFDLGGREVEIVYAPGHASHHMCLFDRQTRVLFCGDLDYGQGSFGQPGVEASVTIFYPDMYVETMHRCQAVKPSFLLRFGRQEPLAAEALKKSELDVQTEERICHEALKKKLSLAEINRRVRDYREWTGGSEIAPVQGGRGGGRPMGGAAPHLIAYIISKNPDLKLPADAIPEVHQGTRERQRA